MNFECPGVDFPEGNPVKCTRPLTTYVWCPTWVGAEKGPTYFCDEHMKTFTPENKSSDGKGSFHFNDEAFAAFNSVEGFFKQSDPNVAGMLANFPERKVGDSHSIIYIDGKAWMKCHALGLPGVGLILNLGDMFAAKARFPKLFEFATK